MSGCHPTQEATRNCPNCHTTHFEHQIVQNSGRCTNCESFFEMNPQEYTFNKLREWIAQLGHRLKIIEDLFEGKSFKPIHDAMELHVEMFHERIEKLEAWRKKLHNDIVCPSGGYMWKTQPSNYDNVLVKKFNDLHKMVDDRLEKLEDYMTMEDRVTASDVLLRLTELERFQDITHLQYKAKKAPHKCPLCEGSGYNKPELKTVDAKMSIDGVECEVGNTVYWKSICKGCEGKGIVWG